LTARLSVGSRSLHQHPVADLDHTDLLLCR
jgi:hypothetical protein